MCCQGRYVKSMALSSVLLNSITDVAAEHVGLVAISGSHGGVYPAAIASSAGLRAVIFNDAGIGLENAGISGVMRLADVGMAGAAIQAMSAQIGSARDTAQNGIISFANAIARELGVTDGMGAATAAGLLQNAPLPVAKLSDPSEAQSKRLLANGTWVHLLDSASMVGPDHVDESVITGSHGALIGGDPKRALKADARLAVFNDAGFGPDQCGTARLAALDHKNIAALCVSAASARIGDAASALETGVISAVNETAKSQGAKVGMQLLNWLQNLPNPSGYA